MSSKNRSSNEYGDKNILLIRHGRTEWNDNHRFQGHTDVPLNEAGFAQAQRTAKRLEKWHVDEFYVSPLTRAIQTADAIAAPHRIKPVVMDDLTEVSFGVWEGMHFKILDKEMGIWLEDPFFLMPEGSETWESMRLRSERVKDVLFRSPHKRIVTVTHGALARGLLVAMVGLDPHTVWNIRISNCSLCGIEVRDGRGYLAFSNDVLHLTEDIEPEKIPLFVW